MKFIFRQKVKFLFLLSLYMGSFFLIMSMVMMFFGVNPKDIFDSIYSFFGLIAFVVLIYLPVSIKSRDEYIYFLNLINAKVVMFSIITSGVKFLKHFDLKEISQDQNLAQALYKYPISIFQFLFMAILFSVFLKCSQIIFKGDNSNV